MLSSKGANILQLISEGRTEEIQDMDTFAFLESKKYIAYDGHRCAYVAPVGEEALEDYWHYIKTIEHQEETLKIAHKANKLSIIALTISGALTSISILISVLLSVLI